MITETQSQRRASEEIEKSMVVTAGAGSGKTMVLVNRYIRLITTPCLDGSQRGIDEVVAITFTEKAAAEMREKVERAIREGRCLEDETRKKELLEKLPHARISTIDSLCANLVRRYPLSAGVIPDFGIISQGDSTLIMQKCVRKALEETSASLDDTQKSTLEDCIASNKMGLQSFISDMTLVTNISATRGAFDLEKNGKVEEAGIDGILTIIRNRAYDMYKTAIYSMRMLDFAGIEASALRLLRQDAGDVVRNGIKSLLVDEYQDTNEIQDEIIRLLVDRAGVNHRKILESGKLFIVGDNNQSIYSFRGANPSIFENWIDAAKRIDGSYVNLETNFRSAPNLIRTYNGIFRNLIGEKYQDVLPDPGKKSSAGEQRTTIIRAAYNNGKNSYIETANMIIRLVSDKTQLKDGKVASFGDIALLVRANRDIRKYTEVFDRSRIPYVLVRSDNLFASDCALFLADMIGFILDNKDASLAYAILASAAVGVTEASIVYLKRKYGYLDMAISSDPSIDEAEEAEYFKANEAGRISGIAIMMDHARKIMRGKPSAEILDELVDKFCLEDYLLFGYGRQGLADFRKIKELASDSANGLGSLSALREFIIANSEMKVEVSEPDILDDNENAVKVMTVHAAKGLEFPIVIFGKANMNLAKSDSSSIKVDNESLGLAYVQKTGKKQSQDKYSRSDREELIRIVYVALTRAMDYLIISDCRRVKECNDGNKWLYCSLEGIDAANGGDAGLFVWHDLQEEPTLDINTCIAEETATFYEEAPEKPMLSRESDRQMRFSPSSLMNFMECPKSFLSYHWYRLPRESVKSERNSPLRKGPSYSGQDLGTLVHSMVSIAEEPIRLDELADRQSKLLFPGLDDNATMRAKAVELSARYLKVVNAVRPCKVRKEIPFSIRVGEYLIEGFIDRIEEHDDGTATVVDIKTNRTNIDDVGKLVNKYKLQLNTYRLAASKLLDNDRVTSRIAFLDVEGADFGSEKNVVIEDIEQIPLEEIEEELIELMSKASILPSKANRLDDCCLGCKDYGHGKCSHYEAVMESESMDRKFIMENIVEQGIIMEEEA